MLGTALRWCLAAILAFVRAFARIPLASVVVPPLSPAALAGYLAWMAGISLWAFAGGDRRALLPARILALGGSAVLAALLWTAALRPAPGDLAVTVLDVGEGTSAVVRLPSGRAVLVDTGPEFAGGAAVAPFLKSRGIGRLAAVVITHPHADHSGGLTNLLRQVRADMLVAPPPCAAADAGEAPPGGARERGIPCRTAAAGMALAGEEGVEIRFLHPPRGGFPAAKDREVDDNSLAMAVTFGHTAFILPGDLRSGGEARIAPLLRALPQTERVLLVPHHGSHLSSSRTLLAAAHPRHAMVSVGARNPFGHPHPAVVIRIRDQGARLWRTDLDGAVEARSDGSGWTLTAFRRPQ